MNNVLTFDIDAITIVKLQAGTDVEVTWKVLEVPDETDVDVCEKKFKIEDLWNEESKEKPRQRKTQALQPEASPKRLTLFNRKFNRRKHITGKQLLARV